MILKGFYDRFKDIVNGESDNVTVSPVSDKVGLDVNVIGGSLGGGATDSATETKQDAQIVQLVAINSGVSDVESAVVDLQEVPVHSHYRLTYVTSGNGIGEVETIRYYTGGVSSEVLVQTRTFTYDASNRIVLVEKS